MQRLVVPLALTLTLAAGAWLLWNRIAAAPGAPKPHVATATPTPTATQAPAATPIQAFRLAGTAVGDPTSWAAIEHPDGSSGLYRTGEEIPGLGLIVAIHTNYIVIAGRDEEFRLNVMPAPTPTPDRRRWSGDAGLTPTATPGSDDTPRESTASDARDRRAS